MATQPFSVKSATVTLGGTAYCAESVTVSTVREGFPYQCLSGTYGSALVSGSYTHAGSAELLYDDTNMDALRNLTAGVTCVIAVTTSNDQLITITATNGIVITSLDGTFSKSGVPTASISWIGVGALAEVVTDPA